MFYTYILQSIKDGEWYVGYTDNLANRLVKHNSGKVFSTKSRLPMNCVYVEICLDKRDAQKREKYLKGGIGKRFIKQRLYHYLARTR